jgi:uncharacterized membrane protein YkvA (DUF1232 family)
MHLLLRYVVLALGLWLGLVAVLYAAGCRVAAQELAAFVPNLLVLFGRLWRDRRVPRSAKLLLGLVLLWLASPIDLIPEFVPVLGPLDDAVVAALALRYLARTVPRGVLVEHWKGDARTIERLLGRVAKGPATVADGARWSSGDAPDPGGGEASTGVPAGPVPVGVGDPADSGRPTSGPSDETGSRR